jgi:two-component system copper resistance phosphate regulon response regulator CusR
MRVLVIEDDPGLQETLRSGFKAGGLDAVIAGTASEGKRQALFAGWTVITLDLNLPDGDGVALCASLRRAGITVPILMLTARDAVEARVAGLEAGADDYLVKPFAFRELHARLWALARRAPALTDAVIRVADVEVNVRTRDVRRGGRPLALTAKEYALLEYFVRHPGTVLDRAGITGFVWDDNHDPMGNALEVLVHRLRAKIDQPGAVKLVHNVPGAGYRFGA